MMTSIVKSNWLTRHLALSKVWRYPACEELMKMSGWVVENDHVRLRDDSHVHALSQFLESYHGTLQLLPTETISDAMHGDMLDAIYQGDGPRLRRLLQQCKTPACNIYFHESESLLSCALSYKQMGIARILINEFSIDVNGINEYGTPCVFSLFKAFTESEIISFVKEFSPNVDVFNSANLSLIEYAVINKCLDVVKFFVEECKVDIDTVSSEPDSFHWTPLHVAYTVDDPRIVAYLIQNGANENAVDIHGRKPIEYAGGDELMTEQSTALICRRNIFGRKFGSDEFKCFLSFLGEGHSDREAVIRTCEKFPSLKNDGIHSNYNLETTPTMNKLNHYITDMAPSYYAIGLELDVPNRKLKVIKNDPSLADLMEKCRKMLECGLKLTLQLTGRNYVLL